METIDQYVLPGSLIATDCWKGYKHLDGHADYKHKTINDSIEFVNSGTGFHTNNMEWIELN